MRSEGRLDVTFRFVDWLRSGLYDGELRDDFAGEDFHLLHAVENGAQETCSAANKEMVIA